jgi:hypothetical protein
LIAQGLEKKAALTLLTGFAVSSLNIVLWDIVFVATKESLPSWRLTFLLVTNQLSLNTKSPKTSFLMATIVVVAYADSQYQS